MYNFRRRVTHHTLRYLLIVVVIAVVSLGIWAAGRFLLQPGTVIKQSAAVTHYVSASDEPTQHITKDMLDFDLPANWSETAPPNQPYKIYSWRGHTNEDASRRLDIYVDALPTTLAVNRLLPVQANGDHLDVTGLVSDNCNNFTEKTTESPVTGRAASKWAGVSFWCDIANFERDVVATGSAEGVNTVTLTGASSGARHLLLLYTDNSASPNYGIFTTIVKSLHIL